MLSLLCGPTLTPIHDLWKNQSFYYTDFGGKVMSLLFHTLSKFFIAFLPTSKCLLISWLQSPSAVILETKKIKSVIVSFVSPSICHEVLSSKWSEVGQSCPTPLDPMDCKLPCSSIHGIFQARILEWVAISFSRRSFQPRNWTQVSCIVGRWRLNALIFIFECWGFFF